MKVDAMLDAPLDEIEDLARAIETAGYDGVATAETSHDPFLPLVLAARATEHLELSTEVAIAFARNPMTVATIANDLQLASKGRFTLGLGSQIKPHVERRFSMPWSHPAARMREFILALRAIWASWSGDADLDFRGEFYTHTVMTPFFDPGPNPFDAPKVTLAAVGELMTEVAGEVADGVVLHPFTTERYLRERTLPGLERGFAKSGRARTDFTISLPVFVVTGTSDEEWNDARRGTRERIAFYGSTPGYHGVLRLHGWESVGMELNALARTGAWAAMGELITDEMLETFAVIAAPDDVAGAIVARHGDILDRVNFYTPYAADPEVLLSVLVQLKATT